MSKFKVGDAAIAVKPADNDDKLGMHGVEVTIIGPLRQRHMEHYGLCWCYLTDWPGHPGWRLRAKPEWLRRKEDKIEWSDCVWRPDTVTV